MEKEVNLTYESSLTNLCEINPSFDKGILRIAYAGANRNGSYISKETFNKCIESMYNCPVVCHYDRETNSLGGHDIEVVEDNKGELQIVHLTTPVGVIPESATYWWDKVTEEDGSVHEYLYTEVLLWKRQEAYQKIKEDGITSHSMEISVKDGKFIDDFYHITSFDFTAFALIGVEPCFESSALEVFSDKNYEQQFDEMMREAKDINNTSPHEVNKSEENIDMNISETKFSSEGGETVLDNENIEVVEDQVEEVVEEQAEVEEIVEEVEETSVEEEQPSDFALAGNTTEEIRRVLEEEKVEEEWGYTHPRYWYVDCDFEKNEVYCYDNNDWLLYGFTYQANGDSISIDMDSKKRVKFVIEDFDEGDRFSIGNIFEALESTIEQFGRVSKEAESFQETIEGLQKALKDSEDAVRKYECEKVFEEFEDLNGIDEFEALRESNEFAADVVREKCYAIRGRNMKLEKFSANNKQRIAVNENSFAKEDNSNKPYGGLVEEYENKYE